MPVKVFGKTYHNHATAAKAAKRKGISKPDAYVATIERTIRERRAKKRGK